MYEEEEVRDILTFWKDLRRQQARVGEADKRPKNRRKRLPHQFSIYTAASALFSSVRDREWKKKLIQLGSLKIE